MFRHLIICLISLGTLLPAVAQAQNDDVERIEVRGKKPKRFYLDQYKKLQKAFIADYNSLVDKTEYQVACELNSTTGSRRRYKTCEPKFISMFKHRETQRLLGAGRTPTEVSDELNSPRFQKVLVKEYLAFQKVMEKTLQKNPDVAKTYVAMQENLNRFENFDKAN